MNAVGSLIEPKEYDYVSIDQTPYDHTLGFENNQTLKDPSSKECP